ncbi:Type IV leader peptidase family protein [Bacillus sp. THAF10]|uniref:A24 family peptidase n=1 Tax=Bacillus sp. THAF10 TaxID=2587848 RepID=UPI001268C9AA|nr:prepilin peptidase [Bacillus sp. THAF10]QFT88465.1 Type IV leader peptidase family protein [Bacillus sp. THAF10]
MLITIVLFFVLGISVLTDLQNRKILNAVTIPAILFGLAYNTYLSGIDGLLFSAIGLFIGFFLLFIPFAFGGMGAGDVKLLASIGAMIGGELVFQSFLYTAIIGGVFAIILLLKNKNILFFIRNIMFRFFYKQPALEGEKVLAKHSIPYGVPIALGVLSLYCFGGLI